MRLVCGLVLKSSSGRARKTESLAGQRQTERENRRTVSFLRVFNNTVAERARPAASLIVLFVQQQEQEEEKQEKEKCLCICITRFGS